MRIDKVIQGIKRILADGQAVTGLDAAGVAAEYAEACKEANNRLAQCRDFLSKQMASEAMHVAESEPVLLDYCALLDFTDVEQWRKMCKQNRWPIPDPIEGQAVSLLNEAYGSAASLEPMLKAYRGAVRLKDTRKCVRLLRQLRDLDPNNAGWTDDLKSFEQKRLVELGAEFRRNAAGTNPEALESLLAELSGEWLGGGDARLKDAVAGALRALREADALATGLKLVKELSDAYSALDYGAVEAALSRYNRLLQDGYFKPADDMLVQYDEANQWFTKEKETRDADTAFEDLLTRVRGELGKPDPGAELERLWMELGRFNRELPDNLQERLRLAIENYAFRVRRKKIVLLSLATVSLLILLFGSAAGLFYWRLEKAKTIWTQALQSAFEETDIVKYQGILADIEKQSHIAFRSPAIRLWVMKRDELQAQAGQKEARFQQAYARLEEVREQEFEEDRSLVESLLGEATANAASADGKTAIAEYLVDWEAFKARRQREIDAPLLAILERLSQRFGKLDDISSVSPSEARAILDPIRLDLDVGRKIEGVSAEPRQQLDAVSVKIEGLEKAVQQRETQYAAIRDSVNLDGYLQAIRIYAQAFPKDKMSAVFQDITNREKIYREFQASESALNADLSKTSARWPDIKAALVALAGDSKLTRLSKLTATLEAVAYLDGTLETTSATYARDASDIFSEGKTLDTGKRRGSLYYPKPQDETPTFIVREIYERNIESQVLMPHCSFVTNLLADIQKVQPEDGVVFLASRIGELSARKNMGFFLQLKLLVLLSKQELKLVETNELSGLRNFVTEAEPVGRGVSWLCVANPMVFQADQEAKRIMDRFALAGLLRPFLAEKRLLKLAATRRLQYVGYASFKGLPTIVLRESLRPREIWVIRSGRDGAEACVAATLTSNGYATEQALEKGEPLLAPADLRTTTGCLATLDSDERAQIVKWPSIWPVNRRGK